MAIFALILAMFLTSQPYNFDAFCTRRGPFGCRMTVQNFVKIVWTVFEKFEIFMKRGEKKQKQDGNVPSRRHILGSKIFKQQLLEKFGKKNFSKKNFDFFSKKSIF